MDNIVILTSHGDVHAAAVAWTLSKLGETPKLWFGSEFPVNHTAFMRISIDGSRKCSLRSRDDNILDHNHARTVWNRRQSAPTLPKEMHDADKPAAERECERFLNSLISEMGESSFWVNRQENATWANHKVHQLVVAARCGLRIPDTLIGNDPVEIASFYHRHDGNIIYKAFIQPHWQSIKERTSYAFFTTPFPKSALDETFSLRSVPGIYQPKIEKAFEIRLTMMGKHTFAAKIDSQSQPLSAIDWRHDILLNCGFDLFVMPEPVLAKCRKFMQALGLVFGCIDLIVTPAGEYIFLEVNQMGQFLWLEYKIREFRMLETFARFLASGDSDFQHTGKYSDLTFDAYLKSEDYKLFLYECETMKPAKKLGTFE